MKNIDELIKNAPKPRRQLSDNFNSEILNKINGSPASRWFMFTNFIKRHSWFALLAGGIVAGGTAAAISLLPTPSVTPIVTEQLPSGNHIVGYDAANCDYYSSLDGHTTPPTSDKVYYEILKGAKLTDEQMQKTLQAVCEENLANNAISRIEKQLPKFGNSTLTYTVDAVSPEAITLSPDLHYDLRLLDTKSPQTYHRFANNLLVYDEDNRISFRDLKAGDSIKFIYNDVSGQTRTPANNYIDLNHPENIVISAILKVPPLTADPNIFFTHLGTDFVRAEPCKSSPTGFCRAYDFIPQS